MNTTDRAREYLQGGHGGGSGPENVAAAQAWALLALAEAVEHIAELLRTSELMRESE